MLISTLATAVALMSAVGVAEAKTKVIHFKGTRDQVRTACADQGGTLVEGADHTWCGKDNGSGVACWDDGRCIGSGPARTFGAGSIRVQPGSSWQATGTYQPQPGLVPGKGGSFQAQ
jgi:hypothetical protein